VTPTPPVTRKPPVTRRPVVIPRDGPLTARHPVTDKQPVTPTSTSASYRRLMLLLLAAAVVAALVLGPIAVAISRAKHRHTRMDTRVHAVSHRGAPAVIVVRETPAPGKATHVVRLESRPDPGTQTIREVDDDYARPR
jgi:hypothetical protein